MRMLPVPTALTDELHATARGKSAWAWLECASLSPGLATARRRVPMGLTARHRLEAAVARPMQVPRGRTRRREPPCRRDLSGILHAAEEVQQLHATGAAERD